MCVYVIFGDYNEVVGIYSTEKAAKEKAIKIGCNDPYIEKWEVDNEENCSIV